MNTQQFKTEFQKRFGRQPRVIARAPGRVNLIGEHTDYNDGFVLPMAIDRYVLCALAPRPDHKIHLFSMQQSDAAEVELHALNRGGNWADYPLGVAQQLLRRGYALGGFEALYWGDVPMGAGLSSSAAMEVSTMYAVDAAFALELPTLEKIKICHQAETDFVGMNCGIMDQFISNIGKKGHALFLDCRNWETRYQKLDLKNYTIMVIDSRKPRMLVDSRYNQRRAECQQAVELLQERFPEVKSLRDVTMEQLKNLGELLPPTLLRRTRHVVTENARVLASLDAFRWHNLYAFGSLMLSSHLSLKEDYEVSCPELDFLVDMVMMQNGSLGARLTGAGFGGCTVNLVETEQTQAIFARVAEKYREKFGLQARLYLCEAAEGAKVVWRE